MSFSIHSNHPLSWQLSFPGCNGGLMLKRVPKSSDQNVIIIATEKDNLKTLNKSGHPICSTELILTGALRQELAIKAFNLRQNSPEL